MNQHRWGELHISAPLIAYPINVLFERRKIGYLPLCKCVPFVSGARLFSRAFIGAGNKQLGLWGIQYFLTTAKVRFPLPGAQAMSYDIFMRDYQTGRSGWSVSVVATFRLFFAGRIREKKGAAGLICWSLGLPGLAGLSVVGFLYLPPLWAALAILIALPVFVVGAIHQIGQVIVSGALANERFYQLAIAQRALWTYADGESDLSRVREGHSESSYSGQSAVILRWHDIH